MSALRIAQVITRWARGGAREVVRHLLDGLPKDVFEQTLVCGAEEAPEGATVVRPLVREIRPTSDARAFFELCVLFQRLRPEIVHAHTYKAGAIAAAAARYAGVPGVVFTPHGHIFAADAKIPGVPDGAKLEVLRMLTRWSQGYADRITALSDIDRDQQVALGLAPASKYTVIRNGIDVERFATPRARLFEGAPVVGAVGRFSSEKGHRVLVDAMPALLGALPGARLVLVGFGPLEAELRAQVARLGLDRAVLFTGERDSAELLKSFDLFAQPSLYESQGIAMIEAMAAEVPVVASAVGGVADVVLEGETGLLVPPSDPPALAAALIRLWSDEALRRRLAAAAAARVRSGFSREAMLASYASLYRELVGR